jgi:ADP-ribose pyrophosphatase YjhB (NUDIX family)
MDVFKEHMLADPALQAEVIRRALAGGFGDAPGQPVHDLGLLALPGGVPARLYLRHAADAIMVDDADQVVLITRAHNPGMGKLALPGGFIDGVGGAVEVPLAAALREAVEETGIDAALLRGGVALGARRYERPFDIRKAWSNLRDTEIKTGDLFAVSTQGFRFKIAGNLHDVALKAGDDAAAVQVVKIADLHPGLFAVPDHLEMILAAKG